jgi:integrase
VLALDSGTRQAELFALEWRDIDWDNSSVEVRRTLKDTEVGLGLVIGDTKNRQRRSIRLSATTIDALGSHRKRRARSGALQRLVFPDHSGGYIRRQNFNRRCFATMRAAAERESGLSFSGHTFHDLRHTCATLLLQDGSRSPAFLSVSDTRR